MNSDKLYDDTIDTRLRERLKEARRVPSGNPWFERRVMAALPDRKQRRGAVLRAAVCSIPLTTMFSGAVVAAPALKRLFR